MPPPTSQLQFWISALSCLGWFGQDPGSEFTHPWQLLKSELQQLGNLGARLAACLETRGSFCVYILLLLELELLLPSVLHHCLVPTAREVRRTEGEKTDNTKDAGKSPWRAVRYLHPCRSSPTVQSNSTRTGKDTDWTAPQYCLKRQLGKQEGKETLQEECSACKCVPVL